MWGIGDFGASGVENARCNMILHGAISFCMSPYPFKRTPSAITQLEGIGVRGPRSRSKVFYPILMYVFCMK